MGDFFDFRSLLPKAINRYNMARETQAAQVCEAFRKSAKQLLAGTDVEPKFFKGHTLYVRVHNSIDAQKVFLSRHLLLEELNKGLAKPEVRDVRALVETAGAED